MSKPSTVQRSFLMDASKQYRSALEGSPAEEYLANRGFDVAKLKPYGLGYVQDPLPGHGMFQGWLAIPYLKYSPTTGWSAVSMRFRCIQNHNHKTAHGGGKYMPSPGSGTHIYNTVAVVKNNDEICLTEGELDSVIVETGLGLPSCGAPGANTWNKKFARMFEGFSKVYVLEDGDAAGAQFGEAVAATLSNVRRIPMPPDMDVNEVFLDPDLGPGEILERMGKNVR